MLNKQQIPIFILTYPGSSRFHNIKKKMDGFKFNYKFIYGLNANNYQSKVKLNNLADYYKANLFFQKKLTVNDIACVYGHLKIYKHIIKNNIKSAIILEDDFSPNINLKNWVMIKNKSLLKLDFIQFYSNSGLIFKKPVKKNKNFSIYKAYTHLPLVSCYQISIKACKFFINYYRNGIFQSVDFPGNYYFNKFKQFYVYPSLGKLDEEHLLTSSNKKIWNTVVYFERIKKLIPFYYFFNCFFSILHIPYLFYFRKFYSYQYYRKYFLRLKIEIFKNYFSKKYILINKLHN